MFVLGDACNIHFSLLCFGFSVNLCSWMCIDWYQTRQQSALISQSIHRIQYTYIEHETHRLHDVSYVHFFQFICNKLL